jgi:4'-phosphopantetheinyl transferase
MAAGSQLNQLYMPGILHRQLTPFGELGLWQITEPESWFLDQLFLYPAELRQLEEMKGRRRVEWLAVRQLVHDMSGRRTRGAFVKDNFGKPHLEGSPWHISISHSGDLAAAVVAPVACGVDVQFLVPKITRLAHKFMRSEEMDSLQPATAIEHLHVYWGAKEALYKAYGRREIDFLLHLRVQPFAFRETGGYTRAWVEKETVCQAYRLHYELRDGFVLTYVLTEDTSLPVDFLPEEL